MRRRVRNHAGLHAFTLIEVVVALVLFGIGMLALEGAALVVLRQAREARAQAFATNLVASRFEQLSQLGCAAIALGAHEEEGVRVEWSPGEILAGRARVVSQTARIEHAGAERIDSYVSVVRCR